MRWYCIRLTTAHCIIFQGNFRFLVFQYQRQKYVISWQSRIIYIECVIVFPLGSMNQYGWYSLALFVCIQSLCAAIVSVFALAQRISIMPTMRRRIRNFEYNNHVICDYLWQLRLINLFFAVFTQSGKEEKHYKYVNRNEMLSDAYAPSDRTKLNARGGARLFFWLALTISNCVNIYSDKPIPHAQMVIEVIRNLFRIDKIFI